jgi:hypothetical protein
MKKNLLILALFVNAALTFAQQKVNYSSDVAKIIYTHCTTCHRKGEIAPFALTNYTEVKNWATMIQYVTSIRYMPPWKADTKYSHFQGENVLTDAEIKTIGDWVTQGTPQGDPKVEPALPVFPKGSQVGAPDKVISFKKRYVHKGNNKDEYRYFVIPTGLTTAKDLVSFEVRPGNPRIVHHTLAWADTTGQAAAEDAKTPEYGYEGGSTGALGGLDSQLPGYVPGQRPIIYNNGISQRLGAKSDIKLQMHYAPTAVDEWDSTTINLFFAQKPAKRYVKSKVLVPTPGVLVNDVFYIPANVVKEFHGTFTMPETATMLNISPHMHKLGQRWEVYAITPNKDTIKMVKINEWDFNWQGTYSLKKPIILPKNSVIHAFAKYDNTKNNINNPNNPPKAISWGENTSDEMYYLPFSWVSYQAGDENLNLEANLLTATDDSEFYSVKNQLYPISPNPARGNVKIGFTLQESGKVDLYFSDLNGRKVKTVLKNQYHLEGLHQEDVLLNEVQNGLYIVTLEINGKVYSQKLIVNE